MFPKNEVANSKKTPLSLSRLTKKNDDCGRIPSGTFDETMIPMDTYIYIPSADRCT
jgi:hypothetical protein